MKQRLGVYVKNFIWSQYIPVSLETTPGVQNFFKYLGAIRNCRDQKGDSLMTINVYWAPPYKVYSPSLSGARDLCTPGLSFGGLYPDWHWAPRSRGFLHRNYSTPMPEATHFTPSGTELKNEWSYTSVLPCSFTVCMRV